MVDILALVSKAVFEKDGRIGTKPLAPEGRLAGPRPVQLEQQAPRAPQGRRAHLPRDGAAAERAALVPRRRRVSEARRQRLDLGQQEHARGHRHQQLAQGHSLRVGQRHVARQRHPRHEPPDATRPHAERRHANPRPRVGQGVFDARVPGSARVQERPRRRPHVSASELRRGRERTHHRWQVRGPRQARARRHGDRLRGASHRHRSARRGERGQGDRRQRLDPRKRPRSSSASSERPERRGPSTLSTSPSSSTAAPTTRPTTRSS